MTIRTISPVTLIAGLVSVVAFATFVLMHQDPSKTWQFIELEGWTRIHVLVTGGIGWLAALVAALALTQPERRGALVFSFSFLALMLFFVHETYQFTGDVRLFPLVVSYVGITLAILDILTVTNTRIGMLVTRVAGSEAESVCRQDIRVSREIIVIGALVLSVLLIYFLGFLIGGTLFVIGWVWIGGGTPFLKALLIGIATFAFVSLLFEVILRYELHKGWLTIWLLERVIG